MWRKTIRTAGARWINGPRGTPGMRTVRGNENELNERSGGMVGMLEKVKLRGIEKVGWLFTFTGAAYHLCRLRNLMARA